MIKEYAVDPSLLKGEGSFWIMLESFGIDQGRVISRFPENWRTEILQTLNAMDIGDIQKTRFRARLHRASKKAIIPSQRKYEYDADMSWMKNAQGAHILDPFHAIIQEDSDPCRKETVSQHDLDSSHPLWNAETRKIIPRTPDAIAECVRLLGRISNDILFVDPNFSGMRKHTSVFERVLEDCVTCKRHFQRIEIHTAKKTTLDYLKRECGKWKPPSYLCECGIHIFVWKEKPCGERFHARYILTERGGIGFEGGLDLDDKSGQQTTDVFLLSDHLWRQRYDGFQEETAAYELIDDFYL